MEYQFIKEISITNFKSIQNITIFLNEQLNAIIGPNGVGKTTLIQALYFSLNQLEDNYIQLVNKSNNKGDIVTILYFQKRQFKKVLTQEQVQQFYINNIQVSKNEYNQQLFEILNIKNEKLVGINQQETLNDNLSILQLLISMMPQEWQQNLNQYNNNSTQIQSQQKELKQLTQKVNQQKKLCDMLDSDNQKQKIKEKLIKKSKQLEKQIYSTKIQKIYQQLMSNEKNMEITTNDLNQYNDQITKLNTQKDELINEQQQKQVELQVIQTKQLALNNELQLNFINPGRQINQEIQKLQNSNKLQQDFIQNLIQEDMKTIDQQNICQLQIDELNKKLENQIQLPEQIVQELQKIQKSTIKNQQEIQQQQRQINQVKQDMSDKQQQLQNIQLSVQQLTKKETVQEQNLQQLNTKVQEETYKLKQFKNDEQNCINKIQNNQKQINQNQKRLQQINQTLSAQDSAQHLLQQETKYQTLLNNVKGPNVVGYVDNLILSDKLQEQRQLIFGNNMKSMIIRDSNNIQEYLLILKKARMNINIFALDLLSFTKQQYNQQYQKMATNCKQIQEQFSDVEEITPFIDKLQFADELLPVAWYLCQDIYYINCNNTKTLQLVNKQLNSKMITQNNIYFSGKGLISVQLNSNNNQQNINNQQISKLIKEKEQLEQQITELTNEITSNQLQLNLLQTKQISEQNIIVNQIDNDLKLQQAQYDSIKQQIQDKQISINKLQQDIKQLNTNFDEQIKQLQKSVNSLWSQQSKQLEPLMKQYNVTKEQIEEYNQQTYVSTAQSDLQEVQIQFQKLSKKHEKFQESIEQNKVLLTKNQKQQQEKQQQLDQLQQNYQQQIQEQMKYKKQIEEIQIKLNQIQPQINDIFTNLQQIKQKYQQFDQIKVTLEKDIQEQTEKLQNLIQQIMVLDSKLFTEQYQPSQQPILFVRSQISNISKFINEDKLQDRQQDLQQIKFRLENEFTTVQSSTYIQLQQDKLQEIQKQQIDLKQQVTQQVKGNNQLEQSLTDEFTGFIQQLQQNVEQIYKKATNQLDPLTPFIPDHFQIFVQTPGDVIRPIKEISGGEKQLLLLCIKLGTIITSQQQLLLLDEIDANLDLEKQQSLNKILLEDIKLNKIQLIIISHNLQTIENFNRIIGLSKRSEEEGTKGWWLEKEQVEQ